MEKIVIKPPFIKLDQLLKFSGIAFTGGEAKSMILDGIVSVNDVVASEIRKKIYNGDVVTVNAEDVTVKLTVVTEE